MRSADPSQPTRSETGTQGLRVAVIVGSTRPGRRAADVSKWVHGVAQDRDDASFELVAWARALRSIREPALVG